MRHEFGVRYIENTKEYKRLYSAFRRQKDPLRHFFASAKSRAKKRGIEFSIVFDDLKIPDVCPIMNIPLFFSEGKRISNTPSIDRIDNDKGYTPENTRIISWLANGRKGDLSVEQIDRLHHYVHGRI